MATTVTSEGQITIPKLVRDRFGIKPGNAVEFELAPDGRVVLAKVEGVPPVSRFARLRGQVGKNLTTDQIMTLTRCED